MRAQPISLPGVVAHRAWLSRSCAELGAFAEGRIHSDAGRRMAEADDLPYNCVSAAMGAGYLSQRQGDLPRAIAVLERGVELCRVWQIHLLFPGVTSDLGVAYALAGRVAEALPLLSTRWSRPPSWGSCPMSPVVSPR